jgi:hypothetical protein
MISYVKESGSTIYVYDENNRNIFIKSGKLVGYTSHSISVQQGSITYVYDETGRNIRIL